MLRERHAAIARALLSSEAASLYLSAMDRDCHDIEGILHTVQLTRSAADNVRDLIAGYGEIWSTRLFHKYFESRTKRAGKTLWLDARRVVVVEWSSLGPAVQWQRSRAQLEGLLSELTGVTPDLSGGAALGALMAAVRRGELEPGARVVLVVTGAQPQTTVNESAHVTPIDPNVHDVLAALGLAS